MRSHQKGSRIPLSLGGAWHCPGSFSAPGSHSITYGVTCLHRQTEQGPRLARVPANIPSSLEPTSEEPPGLTSIDSTAETASETSPGPLQPQLTRSYWPRTRAERLPCDFLDHARQTGQGLVLGQFETTHGQIHQPRGESAPKWDIFLVFYRWTTWCCSAPRRGEALPYCKSGKLGPRSSSSRRKCRGNISRLFISTQDWMDSLSVRRM